MFWRQVYFAAAPLLCGAAFGQTSTTGVDQLIQDALARNREILAAEQRVAETRGLLRQAAVKPAASIETSAGTGRPLRTPGEEEFNAGYVKPVELGGKRSKRMAAAERAIAVAEADLAERRRQLAYEVTLHYLDAVAARRKVDAIGRIAATNRESYRLMDARVQRDDAAPLERQLLLVEVNRTEAQKSAAEGHARSAEIELQRTIGNALGTVTLVFESPSALPLAQADARQRALASRPDLRAARMLESQTEAEIALAGVEGLADVTVSAQYTWRTGQFEDPIRQTASGSPLILQDRDNVVTLGVSIPLQSRRRNAGAMEAATARERAATLRREHLEQTIPLEVDAAWQRYEAARRTVEILNGGVLQESARNLDVIRQAYNLGQLRLLDVLNEQRRLLETELSLIDAETELARARAEVERAIGGEWK